MGISTNIKNYQKEIRDEEYNHWDEKFNRQAQQNTRIHRIKKSVNLRIEQWNLSNLRNKKNKRVKIA